MWQLMWHDQKKSRYREKFGGATGVVAEILDGKQYTFDIYSFGIIMVEKTILQKCNNIQIYCIMFIQGVKI